MDPTKSPAERASDVVASMTLDEKIHMVHGTDMGYFGTAGHIPGIAGLCIPDLLLNDAGAGVADGQVDTTAFPAGVAQAATWSTRLQRRVGSTLGREAWHKGVNVMLAPGVNIARVPMNGRTFEYAGEDPYLAGRTATAVVRGIQSRHVIATVKHYALNNQETDRMSVSVRVGERAMHEIYLPAFQAAVRRGHVGSVMCSYNRIGGAYACENRRMLRNVLEHQLGFRGFVMSDWTATHSTAKAANAGLDMEMPLGRYFDDSLKTAVQNGAVSQARLDDMVTRILRTMFRVGLFDHPAPAEPAAYGARVGTPRDRALARAVSAQSTVLLKNRHRVLPLHGRGKQIALIGQAAGPHGAELAYGGGGSSHVPLAGYVPVVSPLQGISERAARDGDTVSYVDGTAVADAVAAAKAADVAVVYVNDAESEGSDRPDLSLHQGACTLAGCARSPVDQNQMVEAVARANPDTIVVLNTGGPVTMPWLSRVKGVLEAWYPGQEGGNAIASVLFGDVDPAGRLPQTFPRSRHDLPTRTRQQYPGKNGHVDYSEGLAVGYRWFDSQGIRPLFPFGYGLSYTRFAYRHLTVHRVTNGVRIGFTVANTGHRPGAAVPQVYVVPPIAAHEPGRGLHGYRHVVLRPGGNRRVGLMLPWHAFAQWSSRLRRWHVTAGSYRILLGSSSRDISSTATVTVPDRVLGS